MNERGNERDQRRDPIEILPEQAPGARPPRRIDDGPPPPQVELGEQVEGAAEDFAPRTTTDIAQHAPGPHGQGDEPTSAPAGRHDYDDDAGPEVHTTPQRNR